MLLNVVDVATETTVAIEEIDRVFCFYFWADTFLVNLTLLGLKKALFNQNMADCLIVKVFYIVD